MLMEFTVFTMFAIILKQLAGRIVEWPCKNLVTGLVRWQYLAGLGQC